MDYTNNYTPEKTVKDGCAFYLVNWSTLRPINRYSITKSVPALPGLFELYMEDNGKIKPFYMEKVWYGSLRAEIRRASDPLEVSDRARRNVLEHNKCYYRYTVVERKNDLQDLLHAYSELLLPKLVPPPSSGRYEKIFIDG